MLAGLYFERTGDAATLEKIWLNVKAALEWCDVYGDRDGDGFVEYLRETPNGLANQGWKDSHDSISHRWRASRWPDRVGRGAGLCLRRKARSGKLARHFGEFAMAERLTIAAEELQTRFESAFWCENWAATPWRWMATKALRGSHLQRRARTLHRSRKP